MNSAARSTVAAPIHSSVQRLAIVTPSWVGDSIMATPVFRAARHVFPNAKIFGVMRPGLDQILDGSDWFDELIVGGMKGLAGPWRLAGQMKKHGADAVLLLP